MITDSFYGHLVPTLGPRILPALVERLRAACAREDGILEKRVMEGIVAIESDQVPAKALDLLADESPRLRRAAACILARCPSLHALDALWALHCERHHDAAPFQRWEREHPSFVYEDTFGALQACARLRPEWLEEAITKADPVTEPVEDLAYLVAGLGDSQLWERVKTHLFAKVPPEKARSLARNIEVHRDAAEMGWLLERIPESTDLIGSAALRAVVRLDPRRALEALERLPEPHLYFTRNWHLGELLFRLPEETLDHLLNWLTRHPAPWDLAMALQGMENRINVDILDVLLDALIKILRRGRERTEQPKGLSVHRELNFLNTIAEAGLLERFRRRRESRLEEELADWLMTKGPQEGGWREAEKHEALDVLAKIGGPGLTKVVNQWLQGDWYARLHAIKLSPRRPDGTTIRLLAEATTRPGDSAKEAAERGHAAAALAACGRWTEVLGYILESGLKTLTAVTDFRHETARLEERVLETVLSIFHKESTNPGAIMALGFARREDVLPALRSTLASVAPDSETALACTIAIGWLQDQSKEVVPQLERVLNAGVHSRAAMIALLENRSNAAIGALWTRLRSEYDETLALALLDDGRYSEEVISLIQERLANADPFTRIEMLEHIVDDSSLYEVSRLILADDQLREAVRAMALDEEGPFRMGRGRASALRALARFDPDAAFVGTMAALRSRLDRARERYPYVLVEIDSPRATAALLEHARTETSTSVMWAISRALAELDVQGPIGDLLNSSNPAVRRTALHLTARLEPSDWLVSQVKSHLHDESGDLASAAMKALEHLEDALITRRLVKAIENETDTAHRWALVDSLISVGDPGDIGRPWPTWTVWAREHLPLAMRKWLAERLKDRRKKMQRKGEKMRL